MHGVKVYLKSGRDRLYRGMVSLSGAVLVLVAFLLAQANPGLGLYYLGYGVAGFLLLGHSALRPKLRRRWRYLPTVLLLAVTALLFVSLSSSAFFTTALPSAVLVALGTFTGLLACSGPLTVGKRFAYFSPRRIHLRYSVFKSVQFSWQEVANVQLEDDFLEISLVNGKDIRLVPSYKHTQHLRSYLDQISKKALEYKKKPETKRGLVPSVGATSGH